MPTEFPLDLLIQSAKDVLCPQRKREKQKMDAERLYLTLHSARPAWGVFNVTGGLKGWSFASGLEKSKGQVQCIALSVSVFI